MAGSSRKRSHGRSGEVMSALLLDEKETEEGDHCPDDKCKGLMEYGASDGCTCFNNAPCPACMDLELTCSHCGIEEGEY